MPYPIPADDASQAGHLLFAAERQVRHTVIRVITSHLIEGAQISWQGLNFDFTGARFDGGNFSGAEFSGSAVHFSGAKFTSVVSFGSAKFSGGTVDFSGAEFSGGTVIFVDPADESHPPIFDFYGASPPECLLLPRRWVTPGYP